jgi:hypothetical protein
MVMHLCVFCVHQKLDFYVSFFSGTSSNSWQQPVCMHRSIVILREAFRVQRLYAAHTIANYSVAFAQKVLPGTDYLVNYLLHLITA